MDTSLFYTFIHESHFIQKEFTLFFFITKNSGFCTLGNPFPPIWNINSDKTIRVLTMSWWIPYSIEYLNINTSSLYMIWIDLTFVIKKMFYVNSNDIMVLFWNG